MKGLQQAEALGDSDVILPAQWIAMYRPSALDSPTTRVMFAVLEQGINDYYGVVGDDGLRARHHRRRAQIDAREWIRDRRADGPFAFEVICAALRIDADWLRAGLTRTVEPRMARINLVERRHIVLPIRKRVRHPRSALAAAIAG